MNLLLNDEIIRLSHGMLLLLVRCCCTLPLLILISCRNPYHGIFFYFTYILYIFLVLLVILYIFSTFLDFVNIL